MTDLDRDRIVEALHSYVLHRVVQSGISVQEFLRICREELANYLEEQAHYVRRERGAE